jgi:hypothetical protein
MLKRISIVAMAAVMTVCGGAQAQGQGGGKSGRMLAGLPENGIRWQSTWVGGFRVGVMRPGRWFEGGKVAQENLQERDVALGEALKLTVFVGNELERDQVLPAVYCRVQQEDGAGEWKGYLLRLEYATFNAASQAEDRQEWKAVKRKARAPFEGAQENQLVKSRTVVKAFELDLRDWFEVTEEGHYRVSLEMDARTSGVGALAKEAREYRLFDVGINPLDLEPVRDGRNVPMKEGVEERLRGMILAGKPAEEGEGAGKLNLEGGLPNFWPRGYRWANGAGDESEVELLCVTNARQASELDAFEVGSVRAGLEGRIAAEKRYALKLYLAGVAAGKGSQAAGLVLLEGMKNTDRRVVKNVSRSIWVGLMESDGKPADWLVELAMVVIGDTRKATVPGDRQGGPGGGGTVGYVSQQEVELTGALGDLKCARAIPFLIQQVKERQSPEAMSALGKIGGGNDCLLEVLAATQGQVRMMYGTLEPRTFSSAVWALGQLKEKRAAPILLKRMCAPSVIEALEKIGDESVIAALEKVVVDGKGVQVTGSDANVDQGCVSAAKIALAALKPGDTTAQYWALMEDQTMGEFAHHDVLWRIAALGDPRSIPRLMDLIRKDPSGPLVISSVVVLGKFKAKASAQGLIACFDLPIEGDKRGKPGMSPAFYIGRSLENVTGKSFGEDKAAWVKWWREEGERGMEK